MTSERWTAVECATELGIDLNRWYSLVSEARKARREGKVHWAPAATGYDLDRHLVLWDADAVRAGHASRPGQGARTDLRERSTP